MNKTDDHRTELERYLEGFGRNVRGLRTAWDPPLSQERLANLTGLHRTEIGKIEQGKVDPYLTTLVVLAHGLNAKLDDLVADLWIPRERKPPQKGRAPLGPPG